MTEQSLTLPAADTDVRHMPGHWVLAQLGKRVLRSGGLGLTKQMLEALAIQSDDHVVEFAPGMGVTTRLTLAQQPASYTAIERDEVAAAHIGQLLDRPAYRCSVGTAERTGLADDAATVVYGEAMLTMQTHTAKQVIVREAYRILRHGGRYGIHELCLVPDTLDKSRKAEIQTAVSKAIRVSARPLTIAEWRALLEDEGFTVEAIQRAPMHLLEPQRIIQDEGLSQTLRFVVNILTQPQARQHVLGMRNVFRVYRAHLAAVMLVVSKS